MTIKALYPHFPKCYHLLPVYWITTVNHDKQSGRLLLYTATILSHENYTDHIGSEVNATTYIQYSHHITNNVPIQEKKLLSAATILNHKNITKF